MSRTDLGLAARVACVLALAAGCECASTDGALDSGAQPSRDGGGDAATPTDASVDASGDAAGDAARDAAPPRDAGSVPSRDGGGDVSQTTLSFDNVRGESVVAVLTEPAGAGPHPAVLVLHGSGGLHRMPEPGDAGPCSPRLERQFDRWATRLADLGFVVLMPDSFGSRGFCDYNDDPRVPDAFPPIEGDTNGHERRLLARIYDADAALRWLAARPNVRAGAVAVLGFSNGGSTAALLVHHRLSDALTDFGASSDGLALGVPIPPLPGPPPALRQSIAYYPGCGFNGLLPFSTSASRVDQFFYPGTPLRILHAARDSLLDHCSITQTGTRELQADGYASARGLPDRYDITIYEDADHGFDATGCEDPGAGTDADTIACREALIATLTLLEPLR